MTSKAQRAAILKKYPKHGEKYLELLDKAVRAEQRLEMYRVHKMGLPRKHP
jgi:hypothetical protein